MDALTVSDEPEATASTPTELSEFDSADQSDETAAEDALTLSDEFDATASTEPTSDDVDSVDVDSVDFGSVHFDSAEVDSADSDDPELGESDQWNNASADTASTTGDDFDIAELADAAASEFDETDRWDDTLTGESPAISDATVAEFDEIDQWDDTPIGELPAIGDENVLNESPEENDFEIDGANGWPDTATEGPFATDDEFEETVADEATTSASNSEADGDISDWVKEITASFDETPSDTDLQSQSPATTNAFSDGEFGNVLEQLADPITDDLAGPLLTETLEDDDAEERISPDQEGITESESSPLDELVSDFDESPITAEDLNFEELTNKAPVDTAAILSEILSELSEEEPVGEVSPWSTRADHHLTTSEDEVDLIESPKTSVTSFGAESAGEKSIQDYMSQLMQCVSGSSDTSYTLPEKNDSSHKDVKDEVVGEAKSEEVSAQPVPEESTETLTAEEYIPRSHAPEMTSNLKAMRELANHSARTAIDRHSKTSRSDVALSHLAFSAIGVLSSGFLLAFLPVFSPVFLLGCVCVLASLTWAARSILYMLNARRLRKAKVDFVAADDPLWSEPVNEELSAIGMAQEVSEASCLDADVPEAAVPEANLVNGEVVSAELLAMERPN